MITNLAVDLELEKEDFELEKCVGDNEEFEEVEEFEFSAEDAALLFGESTDTSVVSLDADPKPCDAEIGERRVNINSHVNTETTPNTDSTDSDLQLVPGEQQTLRDQSLSDQTLRDQGQLINKTGSLINKNCFQNAPEVQASQPEVQVSDPNVQMISIGAIQPNPNQPRQTHDPDAHTELVESIKSNGLLQPILVRPILVRCVGSAHATAAHSADLISTDLISTDSYEIIAGERRWRACREVGLMEIPVIVRDCDDSRALELALIENLQRDNLKPLEIADSLQILKKQGKSVRQIAVDLGIGRGLVGDYLLVAKAPDDIQNMVSGRPDSMTHARELKKVTEPRLRSELIAAVLNQDHPLSVADLRERIQQESNPKGSDTQNIKPTITPNVKQVQQRTKRMQATPISVETATEISLAENLMTAETSGLMTLGSDIGTTAQPNLSDPSFLSDPSLLVHHTVKTCSVSVPADNDVRDNDVTENDVTDACSSNIETSLLDKADAVKAEALMRLKSILAQTDKLVRAVSKIEASILPEAYISLPQHFRQAQESLTAALQCLED